MPLTSFLLLLVGGFNLLSLPGTGEAVIYYVTPTEPPNPGCLGEPCQTLDYYFSHNHQRSYFCNQINITMKFMKGEHTLKNHTYVDCRGINDIIPYSCFIEDLEIFEMIGMEPAHGVIVYLQTSINLINITVSYFESLTFLNASKLNNNPLYIFLPGSYAGDHMYANNTEQASEMAVTVDRKTYVTTVNKTIFSTVSLDQQNDRVINFSIVVINSTFTNGTHCTFWAASQAGLTASYTRFLKVINSTFSNARLWLNYMNVDVTLNNIEFDGGGLIINTIYSDVIISGEIVFDICEKPYCDDAISVLSSNVTISGKITFANNIQTMISAFSSNITLTGNIAFLNNTGIKGGAMALYSSTLNIARNTSVHFYNNTATEVGGAIYVTNEDSNHYSIEPSLNYLYIPCFYQLLDYNDQQTYDMKFANNSAIKGGDNIYGETMHSGTCYVAEIKFNVSPTIVSTYCVQNKFIHLPDSISSVSSDPTRICICVNGRPQCSILSQNIAVHPREAFKLPAVIVGADLGTTVGPVYANLESPRASVMLKPNSQYVQEISDNKVCTELNFTIFSWKHQELMSLTVREESIKKDFSADERADYCLHMDDYIYQSLLYTPPTLNITFLPCPPGFSRLGDPPGCVCNPTLARHNFQCKFKDGNGYHVWSGSWWLNIEFNVTNFIQYSIFLARYCPFNYCSQSKKIANLQNDTDTQCSLNRAGRLCGGCKENCSLAIGSSHCIPCSNNNNLALLIFFAAAGFLLVLFIRVLNLTVAEGMINGLVFYANIIWTYQSILFPKHVESNTIFAILRVIIAWLNLDFGIQACFFIGLNAFWKTWMQYLFPFYIWSIVATIIASASRSTKLTKVFGDKAVAILVTLFLLSYTKLLQTIMASVGFTPLKVFRTDNNNYTLIVWSLDGHYSYCHFPHILLFIAALMIFILLWLPYTLVLFSIQWLQKKSGDLVLLRFVPKFKPVYDAHLQPLKDKHHYWFGTLLIVRGALLVIFTSTHTVYPNINYIVLLVTISLLLCYSNYHKVYKDRVVQFNENFFFLLLIIIGGTGIIGEQARRIATYASIGVGILGFCGLIIVNKFFQCCCCNKEKAKRHYVPKHNEHRQKMHQEISDNVYAQYCDSIFDETEPLL